MEKEQVEGEIPAADLDRVLAADVAEIAAELDQEPFQLLDQGPLQVDLGPFSRGAMHLVCARSAYDVPRIRLVAQLLEAELRRTAE